MKKHFLFLFSFVVLVALTWCSSSTSMNDTTIPTNTAPINNTIDPNATYETVQAGFDGMKIVPEVTNLVAGKNYKFIVTPTSDWIWAMTTMTIANIDNKVYDIKKWVPITIIINDAKAGSYESVCEKYRMYQWKIIVQ